MSDRLGRATDTFEAALTGAGSDFAERVETEVLRPLREVGEIAAEAHARLLSAARLDDGAGPAATTGAPPEGLWRALVRYRAAVRREVLDPLRERLAELDSGQALADARAELRAALLEAAADAPETLARTEPDDAFLAGPEDGLVRRGRKALVRGGRRVRGGAREVSNLGRRLVRRPPVPPSDLEQTLPLRTLFRYHAAVRVGDGIGAAVDRLQERVAGAVATAEVGITAWTDGLLELDHALDRPEHHAAGGRSPGVGASPAAEAEAGPEANPTAEAEAGAEAAIDAAVAALDGAFAALAGCDLRDALAADLEAAHQDVRPALEDDLRHAGTALLDPEARQLPADGGRDRRTRERDERWTAWHRQVVARLRLESLLEALRGRLLDGLDTFDAEVAAEVVEPVRRMLAGSHATIAALRASIESSCRAAATGSDPALLHGPLEQLAQRVVTELEERILAPLDEGAFPERARQRADARVTAILEDLQGLPETLEVHPLPEADEPLDPGERPVAIRLRQVAEQAYDTVTLEKIRVAPAPLAAAIERIRTECRQLESVIRFNSESALDELDRQGQDAAARLAGAEELALNGLDRTLHALEELRDEWEAAVNPFRETAFEAHARGWDALQDRVRVEGRVQEQIADFGYTLRAGVRSGLSASREGSRRAAVQAARLFRLGRGRALRLVRLGQTALEGEQLTEETTRRTIDALATIDDALADLPLVYRRLFSFQPVTDPGFLEGRTTDLETIGSHFDRWQRGITDAFVVTGFDGNGRTSFLNVVERTVLRGADVRHVRLDERVLEPATLAGMLARALGIEDDGLDSLDDLASRLLDTPAGGRPLVCIVENLEHLFLRSPTDNGIIGAFLAFMSAVDSRVFWLATMAETAWNYVARVEPTTAALVRRHALTPMTRDDLEAVILNRHMRSGLDLDFQPPAVVPPLLRRRLARARTEDERQAVLREDFFDGLARLTGENLILALFYWIRSVSMAAGDGTVHVHPIQPVSFAFIDAFTLPQSFALKAFLDHATLTLEEHDRIFQSTRLESRRIFESLGNLLVIEPDDTRERVGGFTFRTIREGERYRVRPLVIHPVLMHLRARNMIG